MKRRLFILCFFLNALLPKNHLNCQVYPSNFLWNGCRYNYNGYRTSDTVKCYNTSYKLVFEDDFDSSAIDASKWQTSYPWGRSLHSTTSGTGWEREYYTDGNVIVQNGYLYLHTKIDPGNRSPDGGVSNIFFNYTSGMVFSKVSFNKGKFEIRAKIPPILGMWPAFWLYGNCSQEIDIFEFTNASEKSDPIIDAGHHIMTYHKQYSCLDPQKVDCNSAFTKDNHKDLSLDFHIYSVEWNEDKIIWKLDGQIAREVYRLWIIPPQNPVSSEFSYAFPVKSCSELAPSSYYTVVEPFLTNDNPMYIIINNAVLLDRAGQSGALPQDFVIDYVRAYEEIEGNYTTNSNDAQDLNFYPNPTDGNLFISSTVLGRPINEIIIFDELGQRVDLMPSAIGEIIQLDFTSYPKGLYFLKITSSNEIYFRKIIYH